MAELAQPTPSLSPRKPEGDSFAKKADNAEDAPETARKSKDSTVSKTTTIISERKTRVLSGRYNRTFEEREQRLKLPSIHLNKNPLRKELTEAATEKLQSLDQSMAEKFKNVNSMSLPRDYKLYRKPHVDTGDWRSDSSVQGWYKDIKQRVKTMKLQQSKAEAKGDQRVLKRIQEQQNQETLRKQRADRDAQRRIEAERKWLKQVLMEEKRRNQAKEAEAQSLMGSFSSAAKLQPAMSFSKFQSAANLVSAIQAGSDLQASHGAGAQGLGAGKMALMAMSPAIPTEASEETVSGYEEDKVPEAEDVSDIVNTTSEADKHKEEAKPAPMLQWQSVPELEASGPVEKDMAVWISPGVFVTKTVRIK